MNECNLQNIKYKKYVHTGKYLNHMVTAKEIGHG